MKKKCGAGTSMGGICSQPAGHQTIHEGVGRCVLHEETDPLFPFQYTSKKVMNIEGYGMCRDITELRVYQYLNSRHKVTGYFIEPCVIPYYNNYRECETTYTPDLLVEYSDGIRELVELKGNGKGYFNVYKHSNNIEKYRAGIHYAKEFGLVYELWLCEINDNTLQNIYGYSGEQLLQAVEQWESEHISTIKKTEFNLERFNKAFGITEEE